MKKVLIIYGGKSFEHDISIKSYNNIINNIDKNKYIVDSIYITKDNIWLYNNKEINNIIKFIKKYDIVFPIIHGYSGEDGKLQGLLDIFDIKYVGSKCGSSYICMDKLRTKEILNNYNIPMVPYQLYSKHIDINYPIIIKPCNGGSSIGIYKVNNSKELNKYIKEVYKYDNKILLEEYIDSPIEVECACLKDNNELIVEIGTIELNNKIYDYNTKYISSDIVTNIYPNISNKLVKKIKEYCNTVFSILELNNYARIDFFIKDNNIYLNEINTIPGFTNISMFPMLMEKHNISYKELITKLIENTN